MKAFLARYSPAIVGVIWLLAAIGKLVNPTTAISALESLGLTYHLAEGVIFGSIAVELYLGTILLLRRDLKWGISASTALLFTFTVFLWYLSRFAHPPSCGCLGLTQFFTNARQEAWFGLMRNVVLIWLLKAGYDYHVKLSQNV